MGVNKRICVVRMYVCVLVHRYLWLVYVVHIHISKLKRYCMCVCVTFVKFSLSLVEVVESSRARL